MSPELPDGMNPMQFVAATELQTSYHHSLSLIYEEKFREFMTAIQTASVGGTEQLAADWDTVVAPPMTALKDFISGLKRPELEAVADSFLSRAWAAEQQLADAAAAKPGSAA
jgi:hypothetical protein